MTNKIALKEVDQFMSDFKPVYAPIFPLFAGRMKQYAEQVGVQNIFRLDAVGDIRQKHYTPKDTEIKQIVSKLSSKIYKKYFLKGQYRQSKLQDADGISDVIAQSLDEHFRHQDDLLFLGEGTSASDMINNGLFWSSDPNYRLENSTAVSAGSDAHLSDLHTKMMVTAGVANKLSGKKVMFVYGSTAISKMSALHASAPVPFQKTLAEALGVGWEIVLVPSDVTLGSVNGWIAVNMDQVLLHMTSFPKLDAQGVNDENGYSWHNFLMGSCMLEVLVDDAIVRQPCTFA